jgi:hypothetical protein
MPFLLRFGGGNKGAGRRPSAGHSPREVSLGSYKPLSDVEVHLSVFRDADGEICYHAGEPEDCWYRKRSVFAMSTTEQEKPFSALMRRL